jgi:hypothetical protein
MRCGSRGWRALPLLLAAGVAACGGPVLEEAESEAPAQVEQQLGEHGKPTSALRWAHLLSGPSYNSGKIVSDRDGGFLALVNFTGSIDLGQGPILAPGGASSGAMALASYNVNGQLRWVKVFGSRSGTDFGTFGFSHAVDRHRNILLALQADGVDFGNGPVEYGLYLVKLDPQGRLRWLRHLSQSRGSAMVNRIVTDRDDNIGIGGELTGTIDFGRGPVTSKQWPDGSQSVSAFFSKFTPEGENLWTFADSENQSQGFSAAVDSRGNFLLCGTVFVEQTEPFVLMLSPEGHVRWVRRLDGALGFARGVATHGNRVVVVGTFAQSFTFAGQTHTATPGGSILQDGFVAAFTRAGEERWARNFGYSAEDVAMDQRDGVVVAGGYQAGSSDLGVLGPLPGNPATLANVYVAKFDRIRGALRWSRGFTASGADTGSPGPENASIAVTKTGRSAILGEFTSSLTVGSEVWTAEERSDLFLLGFER